MSGCAVVALAVLAASGAAAATFTVTTTADGGDASPGDGACATAAGACSLRAAVMEANALPGAHLVVLPAGRYRLRIEGAGEDAAARGDLDLRGEVTLSGAGETQTIIRGPRGDRVLHVLEGATATITGVTIAGGHPGKRAIGGGIFNAGTLALAHVVLRDNVATGGGAVANGFSRPDRPAATLVVTDSRLFHNRALGDGGALLNVNSVALLTRVTIERNAARRGGGGGILDTGHFVTEDLSAVTVVDSTVSHNRARTVGGGLASENATLLSLTNVTISGNRGRGGGGIGGYGRFKLLNVTIAANRAPRGAGVLVTLPELSTVSFRNVLLAGNGRQNCAGALTALGHNLDADGSCALAGPGDLSRVDPLLGPLASNGGPTLTHALLPGSPAIDAGDDADCPTRDQRGLPRQDLPGVGSAVCDIGAFERQPDER